jgi:hypothetical protein
VNVLKCGREREGDIHGGYKLCLSVCGRETKEDIEGG